MARILKHEIPAASEFTLPLHEGSKLMKLDVVNEKAYIWAIEDDSRPIRDVKFQLAVTGKELELLPFSVYVGTFLLFNGSFVGHWFVDTSVPMKIDVEL